MGDVISLAREAKGATRGASRVANDALRGRKYLTKAEIEAMVSALPSWSRTHDRDSLFIRMLWRHAYRLGEALDCRWADIDYATATIMVRRLKGSISGRHDLDGWELRRLKQWQKAQKPVSVYVFSALGNASPLTDRPAQHIVELAGRLARLAIPVHAHMLRHSCPVFLLSQGVDILAVRNWMGHKDINKTLLYCSLMPDSAVRRVQF